MQSSSQTSSDSSNRNFRNLFKNAEEISPELLKRKPIKYSENACSLIIEGIPTVGLDKLQKLSVVLRHIFQAAGNVVNFKIPSDNNNSLGILLITYETPAMADAAFNRFNNQTMDANHKFIITKINDYVRLLKKPQQNVDIVQKSFPNPSTLWNRLLDFDKLDQFGILTCTKQETVAIFMCNFHPHLDSPLTFLPGSPAKNMLWSPVGTYLVKIFEEGIILLGGSFNNDYEMRFAHKGVYFIEFSPCERFLVTFSKEPVNASNKNVFVWNVCTGREIKSMAYYSSYEPPFFKWSSDGNYFFKVGENTLRVCETQKFTLVNENINVPGIADGEWCPTSNQFIYWVREVKDSPSPVFLATVPSMSIVQLKVLYDLNNVVMKFQTQGKYVCLIVERFIKKNSKSNLEIISLSGKNFSVETLNFDDIITDFEWEPNSNRFAVKYGNNVSVYHVQSERSVLLETITHNYRLMNWCPMGNILVLSYVEPHKTAIHFWDIDNMKLLTTYEQSGSNINVSWDSTGRYFYSYVANRMSLATLMIRSSSGRLLKKFDMSNIFSVIWRPLPPSTLTSEEISKLKKNMKSYQQKLEAEDKKLLKIRNKENEDKKHSVSRKYLNVWQKNHQSLSFLQERESDYFEKCGKLSAKSSSLNNIMKPNNVLCKLSHVIPVNENDGN